MMLPAALTPLICQQKFWRRFFRELEDDHEYPELEECEVVLPLVDGSELVLGLDESLSYFSLGLRHPSLQEEVEIAWDDQAHWHPHVLSWEELDLIGRWVALTQTDLPHPGLVVVLLHRFTPLTQSDDPAVVHPLLEAAYRSLGALRGKALEERINAFDYRDAGFVWRQDAASGWVLEQDEHAPDAGHSVLYTQRAPAHPKFPFELWNRILTELREQYQATVAPNWLEVADGRAGKLARALAESGEFSQLPALAEALTAAGCRNAAILNGLSAGVSPVNSCWVLELLLGDPPGTLIRKHCGRKPKGKRVAHRFEITYPGFPVRPRLLPDQPRLEMTADLNAQLRQRVSGRAEAIGSNCTYSPNGRKLLEESVIIACRAVNDAEEAIRIIREVLRKHGAPAGTRLRQTAREEREIPLTDEWVE